MRRIFVSAGVLLLAAAVCLAVAWWTLPRWAPTERGTSFLLAVASAASGYELKAARVEVPSTGRVEIVGLEVAAPPFFESDRVAIRVSSASLAAGTVETVGIQGFRLRLDRLPSGRGGGRVELPFGRLDARNGRIETEPGAVPTTEVRDLSVEVAGRSGPAKATASLRLAGIEAVATANLAADGTTIEAAAEAKGISPEQLAKALGSAATGWVRALDAVERIDVKASASGKLGGNFQASINILAVPRSAGRGSDGLRVGFRAAAELPRLDRPLEGTVALEDVQLTSAGGELSAEQGSARFSLERCDVHVAAGAPRDGDRAAGGNAGLDGVVRGRPNSEPSETRSSSPDPEGTCAGGQTAILDLTGVSIRGLAAHDPTFMRAAEGLSAQGGLRLERWGDQHVRVDATLSAGKGEVLWDRFYASLTDHPVQAVAAVELRGDDSPPGVGARGARAAFRPGEAAARVDAAAAKEAASRLGDLAGLVADIESVKIDAEGIGSLSLRGTIGGSDGGVDVHAEASLSEIAPAYELFVTEPFADLYPVLARTAVAGTLQVTAHLTRDGSDAMALSATARVRSGRVSSADGRWTLAGIDAEVPLEIDTAERRGDERTGRLRAHRVVAGGVDLGALDLRLAAKTNELSVSRPIDVDAFGGHVRVSGLRGQRLAWHDRSLSLSLELTGLHLADVCRSLGLPSVDGTIEGELSQILVHDSVVETKGTLRAGLLGGWVDIDHIGVRGLGSSVPVVALDARASGLDLERATEALGVGRVSGIADAEITGLEIAGGEPVRFDARLESVPRRGIRQRISVRAIEQLSILGGAGASPITRGILSFFDEYRYAKLGLRCSLRNDRFVLRGVERLKDKDFLVVGTLFPPTVNVISHNQVIAFKDMVARLRRIASVGEGGQGRTVK